MLLKIRVLGAGGGPKRGGRTGGASSYVNGLPGGMQNTIEAATTVFDERTLHADDFL